MPTEDSSRIAQSVAAAPPAESTEQQMKILDSRIIIITIAVIAVFFIGIYFALKLTATEEASVETPRKPAQERARATVHETTSVATQESEQEAATIDISYLLPEKADLPEGWAQDTTTTFGADFLDNPYLEESRDIIAGARRFFDNMDEDSEMEAEIISYSSSEGSSAKFTEISKYYLSGPNRHPLEFLPAIGDNTAVIVYPEDDPEAGERLFHSVVLFSSDGYFGSIHLKGYRDAPAFIHKLATDIEKGTKTS